ncbi:NAD(P)H-binding protein [Streptomyces sp. TRM66268-LWL]|uniref:NAD(P)H-binding protein n=1 Tax=Streptomyces polyasparticus TaxID=2767826 RepID=A0ABR7SU28_9ACTN|nr:NAD(P)H-binding protein [Streptomyces polyasparticus]MBC9718981.1 NAD(P)H-binding protein [Streptomyces polyasparticus]
MKFAVIGGTGRVGQHIVRSLLAEGHEAAAHSRSTGVDLATGEGLRSALAGADVVIDAAQSAAADESAVAFFRTAAGQVLSAAAKAGVRHAVLLSVVGVGTLPGHPYYRAKSEQEQLYRSGPLPYSVVRATQFFEYLDEILSWTSDAAAGTVRLPSTPLQPVAAADAGRFVARLAAGDPLDGIREVAGPEVLPLDELGRTLLAARGDARRVLTDETAGPFASAPGRRDTAAEGAHLTATRLKDWLTS